MEIKWLEDFLSLAATRSFSRAAELRNVTQPAFSRRIRSLEIWMGSALLDRSRYPVGLTEEGRAFLETAEEIVRQLYQARANLQGRASDQLPPASFALTALHSLSMTFLPSWLTALRERLGPVGSRLLAENHALCVQALAEGGYDFFLTYNNVNIPVPLDPRRFPFVTVGFDHLVAVARSDRLAAWQEESEALPLLQYSRGSFLGLLTSVAQGQAGAPKTQVVHVNENSMADVMRSMALEGHGVAWLPQMMVAEDIRAERLTIVAPAMPMEIRLYRNLERSRGVVEKVWQTACDLAQGYAETA